MNKIFLYNVILNMRFSPDLRTFDFRFLSFGGDMVLNPKSPQNPNWNRSEVITSAGLKTVKDRFYMLSQNSIITLVRKTIYRLASKTFGPRKENTEKVLYFLVIHYFIDDYNYYKYFLLLNFLLFGYW